MRKSAIPNLFTVSNLACGFLSIHYAASGRLVPAAWLIVLAGFLDAFGYSVAIEGDLVVVGARFHPSDGQVNSGAVYVFERDGEDTLQFLQVDLGNDPTAGQPAHRPRSPVAGPVEIVGEHGAHAIALAPDGKSLYLVHGNHVRPPERLRSDSPLQHADEDVLLGVWIAHLQASTPGLRVTYANPASARLGDLHCRSEEGMYQVPRTWSARECS